MLAGFVFGRDGLCRTSLWLKTYTRNTFVVEAIEILVKGGCDHPSLFLLMLLCAHMPLTHIMEALRPYGKNASQQVAFLLCYASLLTEHSACQCVSQR